MTRRIVLDDPDLLPTDRIDLITIEEAAEWVEDTTDIETPPEATALSDAHLTDPARRVFERLRSAGVKARSYAGHVPAQDGRERRSDTISAREFDRALSILTTGDLDGAFNTFIQVLKKQPHSTRLWMFVRAIKS